MIVTDAKRVSEWIRSRIEKPKIEAWLGPWVAFGFERDAELVGGVVFDSFTPYECAMHIALIGSIPRFAVRHAFRYPFVTARLQRVTASVAASNGPCLDLIQRWGFVLEGCKRGAFGDEDELIFGLLRQECKLHVQV